MNHLLYNTRVTEMYFMDQWSCCTLTENIFICRCQIFFRYFKISCLTLNQEAQTCSSRRIRTWCTEAGVEEREDLVHYGDDPEHGVNPGPPNLTSSSPCSKSSEGYYNRKGRTRSGNKCSKSTWKTLVYISLVKPPICPRCKTSR